MSNLPQQITINQYGPVDGSTAIFSYNYLVPEDTDIKVYVTPPGQSAIPESDIQTLNVDYTVQGAGDLNGGTVTFTDDVPISSIVTLSRDVEAAINTNYVVTQTITGSNLDDSFQREMLVSQQNRTIMNQRALQYSINSYLPPENEANMIPTLPDNYIWKGQNGAVIATELNENPVCSTLRTDLASEVPVGNGASLVGYYDTFNDESTTVMDFLDDLSTNVNKFISNQLFVAAGTANVITITIPDYPAYVNKSYFRMVALHTNTIDDPTLNINGLGPTTISCNIGDIQANTIYEFVLYGGSFHILNPSIFNFIYASFIKKVASQGIPATNDDIILLDTAIKDPYSLFNPTNYSLTVGIAGRYVLNFRFVISNNSGSPLTSGDILLELNVNGALFEVIWQIPWTALIPENTGTTVVNFSYVNYFNAGSELQFNFKNETDRDLTLPADSPRIDIKYDGFLS